jgi:hypothetical protein
MEGSLLSTYLICVAYADLQDVLQVANTAPTTLKSPLGKSERNIEV